MRLNMLQKFPSKGHDGIDVDMDPSIAPTLARGN